MTDTTESGARDHRARQMCAEMVAEDPKAARRTALLRAHGRGVAVSKENGQ